MPKKKIILFDIDYTLFDTDKYRKRTYPQLMKLLEQEDVPEYHQKVGKVEKELIQKGYESVAFARTLADALLIKPERNKLKKIFYNKGLYKNCLYTEVISVLSKLYKKNDFILGIISKGEITFQNRKIESIRNFFLESSIHISLNKTEEFKKIQNLYDNFDISIIDDSSLFLSEVKKIRPNTFVILIEKENRYEEQARVEGFIPDKKIKDLQEILPLFDNN